MSLARRQAETGAGRGPLRVGDLVAGLLVAAFGGAVLVHVRGFPELPGGQPGPALFPGIVATLMVVFGLALVVQALLGLRTGRAAAPEQPEGEDTGADERAWSSSESPGPGESPDVPDTEAAPVGLSRTTAVVNALCVLGAVVIYMLVAELLGFILTMALLLAALMIKLGTRPLVAAGASVITTALLALIFQQVLLVPLPKGFGF